MAHRHYALALDRLREVGNRRLEGVTLGNLANLYAFEGKFDDARSHYDLALAIHSELGNRRSEGIVLGNLGELHAITACRRKPCRSTNLRFASRLKWVTARTRHTAGAIETGHLLLDEGALDVARSHFDQALVTGRLMRLGPMEGMAQSGLGDLLLRQGRPAEARAVLGEGETLLREFGDTQELATLLCVRGQLDLAEGDVEAARRALAEAEAGPRDGRRGARHLAVPGDSDLRNAFAIQYRCAAHG